MIIYSDDLIIQQHITGQESILHIVSNLMNILYVYTYIHDFNSEQVDTQHEVIWDRIYVLDTTNRMPGYGNI